MSMVSLTLPLLRLFSSNAQTCKKLLKSSEPSLVGIHMKALIENYQMSTHVPGFQLFPSFLSSSDNDQVSPQQHKG